jgi:hypothetical protein
MLEKRLSAVAPQSFTSNGTTDGIVTVADTRPFRVKQEVILTANTLPNLDSIEVKRVISSTQLAVGPQKGNIDARADVSAYTVALGGAIRANEQKRPSVPVEEINRAVYEEEPIVAQRVIPVDELGKLRDKDNPAPTKSGTWWDEADITRDGDDDIVRVEFSKVGNLVETIELDYNGEKSVVKVRKS